MRSGQCRGRCRLCRSLTVLQKPHKQSERYASARRSGSQARAVDNEARAHADLIVELLGKGVRLMRLPVDARRAGRCRALIDTVDQSSSDTLSPCLLAREQVLQVADRREQGGAAMKNIMGETNKAPTALRYESVHGLVRIKEPSPGRARDFPGQCAWACAPVECVIAIPKRQPRSEICRRHVTNDEPINHAGYPLGGRGIT